MLIKSFKNLQLTAYPPAGQTGNLPLKIVFCFLLFTLFPAPLFALDENLKKELEEKQKIVMQNPQDAHAHFDLAITLAYSGYLEEGWQKLKKTDQLDPNFINVYSEKYKKLVAENRDDWRLRFRLAFIYYFAWFKDKSKAEYRKKAISEFEEIIARYPKNIWAYNYIAYIYAEDGDLTKAISFWERSIKIDGNEPITHFVLGHAYLRKNEYLKGLSEISKAYKLKALKR